MPISSQGTSVTLSASTTTASAAIPNFNKLFIKVTNAGTTMAYVTTGVGAATALATHAPVAPGTSEYILKPQNHDFVAVILESGTGKVGVQSSDTAQ